MARRHNDVDNPRQDTIARVGDDHEGFVARAREFQQELSAAGLAGVAVEVTSGGRGLTGAHDEVLVEELAAYNTPSLRPLGIGLSLVVPTILRSGTEATLDGDCWIVERQKVWSSYANDADFAILLARTDLDAAKPHSGMTMFVSTCARTGSRCAP